MRIVFVIPFLIFAAAMAAFVYSDGKLVFGLMWLVLTLIYAVLALALATE